MIPLCYCALHCRLLSYSHCPKLLVRERQTPPNAVPTMLDFRSPSRRSPFANMGQTGRLALSDEWHVATPDIWH